MIKITLRDLDKFVSVRMQVAEWLSIVGLLSELGQGSISTVSCDDKHCMLYRGLSEFIFENIKKKVGVSKL